MVNGDSLSIYMKTVENSTANKNVENTKNSENADRRNAENADDWP